MAFDTAYPKRKDWRKPYQDSRRYDRSCRSHGDCPWCTKNRRHKHERRAPADEAGW